MNVNNAVDNQNSLWTNLDDAVQEQITGGPELLTNTRYYWEGDGIDRLEIYQIEGLNSN